MNKSFNYGSVKVFPCSSKLASIHPTDGDDEAGKPSKDVEIYV
jgi:hypothetical protein